jgi:hypothetical protein
MLAIQQPLVCPWQQLQQDHHYQQQQQQQQEEVEVWVVSTVAEQVVGLH